MRIYKISGKICVVLAMVIACAFITACGAPENLDADYAVGIWKAEYSENGKSIVGSVALNATAEYGMVVYIDGEFTSAEIGTYRLDGNTVTLYKSDDDEMLKVFEYSEGALLNGGHKYLKQKEE